MPSPVTGNSFNIVNLGGTVCDALTKAVQVENLNKAFFTWAFNADGSAITPEFAAMFTNHLFPIGAVLWWPLASVPANCVKADGRSLLRAHSSVGAADGYPELFAVYGTTFGTEDSTHFNVRDLREKFLFGAGDSHPVGEVGGEENVELTEAQLPEHSHTVSFQKWTSSNSNKNPAGSEVGTDITTADGVLTTSEAGANAPHDNMPPYCAGTWVIKVR